MNIAAVCCTYLRPRELGRLIQCFLEQDYPAARRELVILDDAGQYDDQQGDRWRLVSTSRRFHSLGEKRNVAAAMVADDVEALAVWDDDDVYLPWALSASVAALETADWSRPSLVLHARADGALEQHLTGGLFHGGWAYRREVFERVGGYPAENNGEDQSLARRLEAIGAAQSDPCRLGFLPFYVYSWACGDYHLSGMGPRGYQRLGRRPIRRAELKIAWPRDYRRATILPEIHPRVF